MKQPASRVSFTYAINLAMVACLVAAGPTIGSESSAALVGSKAEASGKLTCTYRTGETTFTKHSSKASCPEKVPVPKSVAKSAEGSPVAVAPNSGIAHVTVPASVQQQLNEQQKEITSQGKELESLQESVKSLEEKIAKIPKPISSYCKNSNTLASTDGKTWSCQPFICEGSACLKQCASVLRIARRQTSVCPAARVLHLPSARRVT